MISKRQTLINATMRKRVAYRFFMGAVFFSLLAPRHALPASESQLQDPTQPAAHSGIAPAAKPKLVLQAVFLHESGNRAVINGKLLRVGDVINQQRITSIHRNKIFLGNGDNLQELQLRPSILLQSPSEG